LEIAKTRAAVGAASALEPLQADAALQAAKAALAQAQRQQAIDRSTLALLTGHTGELPHLDLPPLKTPAELPVLEAGTPSSVLAQRPDIRAAEAQLAAAAANVEQARLALFPRLTLTASLGQASRDLTGLFAGGSWIWGIAPQLLQPLWDAGRLRAGVDSATAAQRSALAAYERAVQAGFKDVFDALSSREFLTEQWQAQDAAVSAEAARVKLAETRHHLGSAGLLDVLDAQRAAWAAQISRTQVQALVVLNQVNLVKALGVAR
jgi:NodT family efflux transporter outer membrane factor (OMF) lipoprotein